MAMTGGSFEVPRYAVSWPQGEFGAMGLEGAVHLGFRQELAEAPDDDARQACLISLLAEMYDKGRATEAASYLEIDAVIEPRRPAGDRRCIELANVRSDVEAEVNDVAISHNVFLTLLGASDPRLWRLARRGGRRSPQTNHFGTNKAFLEIGMDDSGGLWRGGSHANRPGADLLGASREVGLQVQ
jgi:hypothetical protein